MVLAVFVVISHISTVLAFGRSVDCTLFDDVDFFVKRNRLTLGVALFWVVSWVGALVLPAARSSVLLGERCGSVSVVSLRYVDAGVEVDLGIWSLTGVVLSVVDAVLDVELGVGVPSVRFTVPGKQASASVVKAWWREI